MLVIADTDALLAFAKQSTFFDAIVAAVAKQQKADAIFSFDKWYKKPGFRLAEDLLS